MSFAKNLAQLARLLTATVSGVVTGTTPPAGDNTKALATTEWFKAEQATEAVQGTAKVATPEITKAGADDATMVTPKKLRLGFAILLAATGYIVFPSWLGGLIIQWGQSGAMSGGTYASVAVTFPVAFTSACYACMAMSSGAAVSCAISSSTATGTTITNSSTAASFARYIAIGV